VAGFDEHWKVLPIQSKPSFIDEVIDLFAKKNRKSSWNINRVR
jgi:hypothetical protein